MPQPRPVIGYAMVALAATLFAVNGHVSKVVLACGISSGELTEVRCAVHSSAVEAASRPAASP